MSEDVVRNVEEVKAVVDAPVEKPEEKRFTITLEDNEKSYEFSGPEATHVNDLEKVAYRLLKEFVRVAWREELIAEGKKAEALKAEADKKEVK